MNNRNGTREAVLALLTEVGDGLTAGELADRAGLAVKGVRDCLWRLRRDGEVELVELDGKRVSPVRYVLAGRDLPPPPAYDPHDVSFRGLDEAYDEAWTAELRSAPASPEEETEPASAPAVGRAQLGGPGGRPAVLYLGDCLEQALLVAERELQRYVSGIQDQGLLARIRLVERLREDVTLAERLGG
jgi:hypothetical protein